MTEQQSSEDHTSGHIGVDPVFVGVHSHAIGSGSCLPTAEVRCDLGLQFSTLVLIARDPASSQFCLCLCPCRTGYGLEVDMWAAGVILYILLCGFPPFRSPERDQDELFNIIQLGRFEFLAPYWDNISDGEIWGFPKQEE